MFINYVELKSRSDLADFLDIPLKHLTYLLYKKKTENCYSTFEIPKKNGEKRQISAPNDELSSIQKKIAIVLWKRQKEIWKERNTHPNISHAFEEKKGIITNARVHRNKRFVLNLDLENFFGSIHFGRVRGFFVKNSDFKTSVEVATIIAQLCCFNGCLPQGAPSSPIITNLICQILDFNIMHLAKKYRLDYTRYADDLTFSTNDKHFPETKDGFLKEINNIIVSNGFSINNRKTRISYKSSKQMVTGLIVNKKLNVDRKYCKQTYAMAHNLYENMTFQINGQKGTIAQLEGRFSFINQLDKHNNKVDKVLYYSNPKINNQLDRFSSRINIEKHHFRNLNGRERQYQKFLFYKYFYGNVKPLIVTEGPTDIVYLRCALKNLYIEYPELITRKSDGSFSYRISFFKRTKRFNYFFDLSNNGADSIKKIYNLFTGKDSTPNYYDYLMKFRKPNNPVFLVFDNEINTNKKPLKTFSSYAEISDKQKHELSDKLLLPLLIDGNLYVCTNPLINNQGESEIEDLFDQATLEHTINGKSFSREKDCGKNGYYGKEIFSRYIASNYQNINFDNFKPLLNKISDIVKQYK